MDTKINNNKLKLYPKAACSLIINSEGFILATSRKKDHTVFGLPGGKVDESDINILEAAKRELLEETGLIAYGGEAVYTSICYGSDNKHYLTTTFIWNNIENHPSQIKGEGIVAWVSPDVICKFHSGKYESFGAYNRDLFESLKIYYRNSINPPLPPQPPWIPPTKEICSKFNEIQKV